MTPCGCAESDMTIVEGVGIRVTRGAGNRYTISQTGQPIASPAVIQVETANAVIDPETDIAIFAGENLTGTLPPATQGKVLEVWNRNLDTNVTLVLHAGDILDSISAELVVVGSAAMRLVSPVDGDWIAHVV